jgi:hypothetical protein
MKEAEKDGANTYSFNADAPPEEKAAAAKKVSITQFELITRVWLLVCLWKMCEKLGLRFQPMW